MVVLGALVATRDAITLLENLRDKLSERTMQARAELQEERQFLIGHNSSQDLLEVSTLKLRTSLARYDRLETHLEHILRLLNRVRVRLEVLPAGQVTDTQDEDLSE